MCHAHFSIFKVLHIIAGFTALLVFWIPVVTKKGGKAHVRSGWVYVWAMGAVAISALVMGIWRIGFDPQKQESRLLLPGSSFLSPY